MIVLRAGGVSVLGHTDTTVWLPRLPSLRGELFEVQAVVGSTNPVLTNAEAVTIR